MRRSTWKGVSRDSVTPWSWSVLIFILKPLWTLFEFSQLRQHNSAPAVIFTIACRRSTSRGGRRDVSHNSVYQVWHDHVWVGQRFLYYLAVDLVCAQRVRSSRTSRCPFSLEAFSVSILLLWVTKPSHPCPAASLANSFLQQWPSIQPLCVIFRKAKCATWQRSMSESNTCRKFSE